VVKASRARHRARTSARGARERRRMAMPSIAPVPPTTESLEKYPFVLLCAPDSVNRTSTVRSIMIFIARYRRCIYVIYCLSAAVVFESRRRRDRGRHTVSYLRHVVRRLRSDFAPAPEDQTSPATGMIAFSPPTTCSESSSQTMNRPPARTYHRYCESVARRLIVRCVFVVET